MPAGVCVVRVFAGVLRGRGPAHTLPPQGRAPPHLQLCPRLQGPPPSVTPASVSNRWTAAPTVACARLTVYTHGCVCTAYCVYARSCVCTAYCGRAAQPGGAVCGVADDPWCPWGRGLSALMPGGRRGKGGRRGLLRVRLLRGRPHAGPPLYYS
eukprot:9311358-Pyramimonas_sp.AAC.3